MPAPHTIACVLAKHLPIQTEQPRHGAGIPLIIAHPIHTQTVLDMSEDVENLGVIAGMSLYQAEQLAPEAVVIAADELAYHGRHGAMEAALHTFTPAIETHGLGEFFVDLRGLESVHGNLFALACALREAARSASGLAIQVGVASGKFTAQQAARSVDESGVRVIAPSEDARFLAPLPLTVLPHLPGELRRRMHLLDLHTLGDLAGLRKPAVLRQFGGEMASLYELACGRDPRPVNPDVPPLRLVHSLRLTCPVSERSLVLNALQRLSSRLSQTLQDKGYHAEALKVTLSCEGGVPVEAGSALKPPTSDAERLRRLAAQLLGRMDIEQPVSAVAVCAYPLRSWHLGTQQMMLVEAGTPEKQLRLEDALQLLAHRFGEAMVRIATLLGPPVPVRIDVMLGAEGLPARLVYGGGARVVLGVDEQWREERFWWDRPVRRECFRVVLADGSLRNIFQNLINEQWYLDRAWPLL